MTSVRAAKRGDRVRIPEHVHVRQFDDELVILDLMGGEYFALNEVGARIWRGLADGRTLDAIAASIVVDLEATQEAVLDDCVRLVDELVGRGLVKLATTEPV